MQSPLRSRNEVVAYSNGILVKYDQTICVVAFKLANNSDSAIIKTEKVNDPDLILPKFVNSLKLMKPLQAVNDVPLYWSIPQNKYSVVQTLVQRLDPHPPPHWFLLLVRLGNTYL